MNLREAAQQATPREQLLKELMDSRVPKTEREHAAAREIERLRAAGQQTLEAMELHLQWHESGCVYLEPAVTALRAALAEEEVRRMRSESEMTPDDIIRMARKAGWQYADGDDGYKPLWRFAALVAAHEREACAKICEDWPTDEEYVWTIGVAIRARGEK